MGELTHEELLRAYSELQLRVTRFSAVEQELINTRDALDQELELYKRFQQYATRALQIQDVNDFVRLMAEACVDVLELESSIVYIVDSVRPEATKFYVEGISRQVNDDQIKYELDEFIRSNGINNSVVKLQWNQFNEFAQLSNFDRGVCAAYSDDSGEYNLYLLSLVSVTNKFNYTEITERLLVLFKLLSSQFNSILSIRKRNERIEHQMHQISANEIELKKLSLIAKRTKSGVIITDTYGQIEWVNDAFTKISGYELDEKKKQKTRQRTKIIDIVT